MLVNSKMYASINFDFDNETIKKAKSKVFKLQTGIAKAVKQQKWRLVKNLQRLLTHSFSAKIIAVHRVTSNAGANTPGVDNVLWKTKQDKINAVLSLKQCGYKPKPLRRILIPKKDKNKLRPLSIPTLHDRAMQALYLLALEPVAVIMADPNSYGFIKHRSCADAVEQCFKILCQKYSPQWIFEADIKACFDNISHIWLIDNIPMEKNILRKWLKAGYIENKHFFNSQKGTPQGGIISPTLMNMTLDGLEKIIRQKFPLWKRPKIHFIRYADDFVITSPSKEIIENEIKPLVENFLKQRGLEISQEKTRISHISEGFDFLSQNIRKYKGKLLIKPSKQSVKSFKQKLKETFKKLRGHSVKMLITKLNPIIRGWANYHRHIVAKATFWKLSKYIFDRVLKWLKSEHSNKKINWIFRNYLSKGDQRGRLSISETDKYGKTRIFQLFQIGLIPIRRHTKVKSEANYFLPEFEQYYDKRKQMKFRENKFVFQKLIYICN